MAAELIVFEGIDGSGKTTLSHRFVQWLRNRGERTVWLREPSDSPAGRRIRELASSHETIDTREELDHFLEDRRWNVERNIRPALDSGSTVVMDRYFYSNACYQGARGMDVGAILEVNRVFAPEADIVFLIDSDVDAALSRIRRDKRNPAVLFEKKEFLETVRRNYLDLSRQVPGLVVIPGDDHLDIVFARITAHYRKLHGEEDTRAPCS